MNAYFIPIFVKMEQHVWTTRWVTIHVSVSTDGRGETVASTSTTVRTTLVITGERVMTKWDTTTATVPTEKQVSPHFLMFSWKWYFQWNCFKISSDGILESVYIANFFAVVFWKEINYLIKKICDTEFMLLSLPRFWILIYFNIFSLYGS